MRVIAEALLAMLVAGMMTASPNSSNRSEVHIEVGVDPRVELLSIVFRIGGAREYQHGRVPVYAAAVDSHFGPFTDHRAVEMVGELRRQDGISHDAVIKLAVHIDDATSWSEAVPLEHAETLGSRWRPETAKIFLEAVRSFAQESEFDNFLSQHESLFMVTGDRLKEQLATADLAWLEEFFGESSRRIHVIPGMLTGRASYGATVVDGTDWDRYSITGVESVDGSGLPQFDRSVIEATVHELCHSYIRPVLEEHADDLRQAGEALYVSQRPKMEAQAYRSGYTVMNETLTRACTNRYLGAEGLPDEAEDDFSYNRSRGFVWIENVSRLLGKYESHRDRYPVFGEFAPELIRFFDEYTKDLPRSVEEARAKQPRVVRLVPRNGAIDVDPGLETIEVTFDRPMRTDSWSVVGGGAKYPKTGSPAYDSDRRVFRLPVQLEPDHDYELWLNHGKHASFVSDEGLPLEPFQVTFRTRSH